MAGISGYLSKILAAEYGEEVRGSIHDAIAAMNQESSNAMAYASSAKDSAASSASAAAFSASSAASSASSAKTNAETAKKAAEESGSASAKAAESAKEAATAGADAAEKSAASAQASADEAKAALAVIEEQFEPIANMRSELLSDHAIYDGLTDSSDDAIMDSDGEQIYGKVVYADARDVAALKQEIEALKYIIASQKS